MAKRHLTVEQRFWSKVDKSGECWVWTGHLFAQGYGAIKIDRKNRKAHRVSWEYANGAIPDGFHVCHKCDNRPCVNPAHLFLGTDADNMADMVAKGRQSRMKGTRNPRAKLTEDQVRYVRGSAVNGAELARRFGVNKTLISSIRLGRIWTHI